MATNEDNESKTAPKMHRRDLLRSIELEVQNWWEKEGQFEADAGENKEKFFINFPFPYMNGRLHLGHAYSLTKCDFTAGFQRLMGKNVLFPFGFHCTGMPIQAAANRLKREIQELGCPPKLPEEPTKVEGKKVKSKIAAKTGNTKLQWDIMRMLNVDEADIPSFTDPLRWLDYFTPLGEKDLRRFGVSCDWRRSFITTDENKFFDKFVRWQFYKLKEKGKIAFGKRPTVYSPLDMQACADHDRSSGEGVVPQEYTLIKLGVIDCEENHDKVPAELFKGKKLYLVAATLRPETMYGQTNCFLLPDGEYLVIEMNNSELFFCSERSARNMSFQGLTPEFGKFNIITKFKGKDLIGLALDAPRTSYEKIYTLPLLTISMKKGTGVVTSVPSDAPDDFAALRDWQTDEKLRNKYGVKKEWVESFQVIPIIEIPGLGSQAAVTLCEKHKVKSQKDKQKLADIKAEVYKKGFYEGVMIVGNESIIGKKVCDVKDIAKEQMVEANEAVVYYEPENEVKSRSGDECVVTYLDQWYLTYGEEKWMNLVKEHVNSDNFTAYTSANLKQFNDTLDWLGEWACSRSFGLGTRLPWDPKFIIESLSDSTVHMAYYTIAHIFQGRKGDTYTGKEGSPCGIDAASLDDKYTNALFDYVFLDKKWDGFYSGADEIAKTLNVSQEDVEKMRNEFNYWYPFDLRTSAKDLIKNHLTFCLYNHAAIWEDRPDLWPRSFFTNGQVMVDALKMSKSVGNFIMLDEALEGHIEKTIGGKPVIIGWGADATRFACADAGDTLEDSNFSCDTANSVILRLTTELDFIKSVFYDQIDEDQISSSLEKLSLKKRGATGGNFHDKSMIAKMNHNLIEAKAAYESMRFRDVLKFGFFNMQSTRDTYRDACAKMGIDMDEELIKDFIEKQIIVLSPICKHFCEFVWRKVMKRSGSVTRASWPETQSVDMEVMRTSEFIEDLVQKSRKKVLEIQSKGGKDATKESILTVFVSDKFPQFKEYLLEFASEVYDKEEQKPKAGAMKLLKQFCVDHPDLKPMMKKAMQVGAFILKRSETDGERAFEKELLFDQLKVLGDNKEYIELASGVKEMRVVKVDEEDSVAEAYKNIAKDAEPGSPTFVIEV